MLGDDEINEMNEEIKMLEQQLAERRKQMQEKRYGGLRDAINARKEADKAIMAELKKLGYNVYRSNWMF